MATTPTPRPDLTQDPVLSGQVQKQIQDAINSKANPRDIVDGLKAANYPREVIQKLYPPSVQMFQAEDQLSQMDQPSGMDRFLGAFGHNLQGAGQQVADTGGAFWDMLQGARRTPEGNAQAQQGMNRLNQMYIQPSWQEANKAMDAFGQGDIMGGISHTVGDAPLVGPGILDTAHKFTHGQTPEALANLATFFTGDMAGGVGGMLKDRVLTPAGRTLYTEGASQLMDPSQMSRGGVETAAGQGFDADIQGRRGPSAQPHLDKLQDLIKQGTDKATDLAKNYQGGNMQTLETLGPVERAISERTALEGPGHQEVPLEQHTANYVEERTGIKRDPQTFPQDKTPRGYMQRVLGIDPGRDMSYWQELNRKFNRVVADSKATQSVAQASEGSAGETMYNRLQQEGIRQGIQARAPEIGEINQRVSQMINLKEGLEDLAKRDPGLLHKLIPLVGGAVTAGATGLLHIGSGHLPTEFMAPVGIGAIGAYATRLALKDPAALMRMGLALKHAGEDSLSQIAFQVLKTTPKLSFSKSGETTTK